MMIFGTHSFPIADFLQLISQSCVMDVGRLRRGMEVRSHSSLADVHHPGQHVADRCRVYAHL